MTGQLKMFSQRNPSRSYPTLLSAVATDRVEPLAKGLRRLGQTHTVAVGGLGASAAAGWGAVMLPGDTVAAAEHAGALLRRPSAR